MKQIEYENQIACCRLIQLLMLLLIRVKESCWKLIIWGTFYTNPNRILKGSELCIRQMRKKITVNRFFCFFKNLSEGNWIPNPELWNRYLFDFCHDWNLYINRTVDYSEKKAVIQSPINRTEIIFDSLPGFFLKLQTLILKL